MTACQNERILFLVFVVVVVHIKFLVCFTVAINLKLWNFIFNSFLCKQSIQNRKNIILNTYFAHARAHRKKLNKNQTRKQTTGRECGNNLTHTNKCYYLKRIIIYHILLFFFAFALFGRIFSSFRHIL